MKVKDKDRNLKDVNIDTWKDYTIEELFMSQYPGIKEQEFNFNFIEEKFEDLKNLSCRNDNWMGKKINAATHTSKIMSLIIDEDKENNSDDDSDDDDDGNVYGLCGPDINYTHFLEMLPYNFLFDYGFLVMNHPPPVEENCYCPCSIKMSKWRSQFKINIDEEDMCDHNKPKKKWHPFRC